MWQFYFAPPTADAQVFHLVTTRRVIRLTVKREGTETVIAGRTARSRPSAGSRPPTARQTAELARAELALPADPTMRVSNTRRGTLEVVLASIAAST